MRDDFVSNAEVEFHLAMVFDEAAKADGREGNSVQPLRHFLLFHDDADWFGVLVILLVPISFNLDVLEDREVPSWSTRGFNRESFVAA